MGDSNLRQLLTYIIGVSLGHSANCAYCCYILVQFYAFILLFYMHLYSTFYTLHLHCNKGEGHLCLSPTFQQLVCLWFLCNTHGQDSTMTAVIRRCFNSNNSENFRQHNLEKLPMEETKFMVVPSLQFAMICSLLLSFSVMSAIYVVKFFARLRFGFSHKFHHHIDELCHQHSFRRRYLARPHSYSLILS